MDVLKNCVARRTRYHRRKADEQLLEIAKMLKDEKNYKSKRRIERSSKADRGQDVCSNIEILGEDYVSPDQGRELPKSRTQLHQTPNDKRTRQTDDMDVPYCSVAKRTRNQCQKALLEKEKILKDEKDKKKSSTERSSKKPTQERSSKDDGNESSCSDIEILGHQYIPLNQRRGQLPKLRIAQLHKNTVIEQTLVSSLERDSKAANQNQGIYKEIGAPSRSNSNSVSSSEIDMRSYKGGNLVLCGDESDHNYYNEDANQNQGRQVENGNRNLIQWESSSEEDGDESDNNDSLGDNQDQGSNVESDPSLSISEFSSEENDHESDDDYTGDESMNTESEADNSSDYTEDNLDGDPDKDDGRNSSVNRNPVEERVEYKEDEDSVTQNTMNNSGHGDSRSIFNEMDLVTKKRKAENVHDESGKKNREVVRKQSKKNNHELDFVKILADSIWEKGDALEEKLPSLRDPDETTLLLKFRFEDEDLAQPEKSDEQKEVDNLFTDLAMAWTEDHIGSTKEDNDDAAAKVADPVESCQLGHHFLILDEHIGIICKYCGTVQQELKHILPDLKIPTWRIHERFDSYNDECSISYGFQFGDSAYGDHHPIVGTEGPVLDIIPAALRRQMYPHQLDGFRFLWKNIAGATFIQDMKTPLPESGTGCIISHAPGTGKTYLTIVFLLTFMKVHPSCRPVIIAPLTMLRAWADELKRWKINIPFHNLNDPELSGEENAMATSITQRVGCSNREYVRMLKLYSWTKDRSILGIGYSLFEKLAGDHRRGDLVEKFKKILLELPSILILDEGHTPRNQNSLLWKALTKVKTGRRIILSGTPFQNNFDELYNTFCLVNPKFAEHISVKRCRQSSKRNSNKGRWASLTNLIGKNADDAVEELRAMMDPFVHVHKGTILQESLPGLKDTLVVLNPTDLQKKLLPKIPDNVLEKVHLVSLLSVHPSLLAQHKDFSDQRSILENLEMSPEAGVKTQFVVEIIRLSNARGEKVLIFSEYLDPLNFLMKQLTSYFSWEEGKEVLYMDGKLDEKQRQLVINSLNAHNSEAKVLLASTKACCEGINLVGASRVILLDVVWNPSVERQAISRAYRLGQKKFVYVYHLIMSGTMEVEKYQRQAKKDRISELVFSSPEGHDNNSKISGTVSDDNILEAMIHHKKLHHIFEEILHQPKESNVFEKSKLCPQQSDHSTREELF